MKNKFSIGMAISGTIALFSGLFLIAYICIELLSNNDSVNSRFAALFIGFFFFFPFLYGLVTFIVFTGLYLNRKKNLKQQEELLEIEKRRVKKQDNNENLQE